MELKEILPAIVQNDEVHCKWLNTLSFMENCGARKISASEHPTDTNYIVLKHAAEEHRHAFYLKTLLRKINLDACPTYSRNSLLAPVYSYHYLHALDTEVSRMVKEQLGKEGYELKFLAYLFVTYAIEVRADDLYDVYQKELEKQNAPISVISIILEEEGHLEEMIQQLEEFSSDWKTFADQACAIEEKLYQNWITAVGKEVGIPISA